MKRLAVALALTLAFPAAAQADHRPSRWLTPLETTEQTVNRDSPQYEVMSCDEQEVIGPGETRYLEYPGQFFIWAPGSPTTGDVNQGPVAWWTGVFEGWAWHEMAYTNDTGYSTMEIVGVGNDTHSNSSDLADAVVIGTRRYWDTEGDAYSVLIGLKVVHKTGKWPVMFERADC